MRQVVAGAALLAAGCMVSVVQAAAPVRGYDPVKDDGIQTLPLYMVALQETVRPQYGYLGLSPELVTQSFIINPVPGISPAAGIVGGALGGGVGQCHGTGRGHGHCSRKLAVGQQRSMPD